MIRCAPVTPPGGSSGRLDVMLRRIRWGSCLCAIVLGVVTSVAVSWAIAMAKGENIKSQSRAIGVPKTHALLSLAESASPGRRFRMITTLDTVSDRTGGAELAAKHAEWAARAEKHAWPDSWLAWGDLHRSAVELFSRRQSAFGFPLVCLWYERSGGLSMFGSAMRLHGGYEISKALGRERSGFVAEAALPLRPVWTGMALNTLLYSAAWFGVIALIGRWRRARRSRAGVCPKCRYDLRGLPADAACPECGNEA